MADAHEVLRAAAEWVYVPRDAQVRKTDEYWLVAHPPHFSEPTIASRLDSARPADALVDDVMAAARELGRDSVAFTGLTTATRPPDLEATLLRRGAEPSDTLAVLALDLARGVPDLHAPDDLELLPVVDLETRRDVDRIDTAVFGGHPQTDERLAASADAITRGEEEPRVLALRDGVPVGTAGFTVAGDVVRLWGAAVLPEARGTGVYRALLDHRLRAATALGCRTALVKGKVDTSAPVLRRAGFVEYGVERCYRLREP